MGHTFKFYGLNLVRFISVLSFILVLAGSFDVMVTDIIAVNNFHKESREPGSSVDEVLGGCDYIRNSTVPHQTGGVAWAVINRLFIIAQVTILAFSELGWFARLFDKFFPVLGPGFGLGPLGIFQCLIGGTVLSHHVRKISLGAAFLLFSVGCLNILIGLSLGVTAKTIRSGGTAPPERRSSAFYGSATEAAPGPGDSEGLGFGKDAEKAATMEGIPLPECPPPAPAYSPSRPPSLKSRNVSSTS